MFVRIYIYTVYYKNIVELYYSQFLRHDLQTWPPYILFINFVVHVLCMPWDTYMIPSHIQTTGPCHALSHQAAATVPKHLQDVDQQQLCNALRHATTNPEEMPEVGNEISMMGGQLYDILWYMFVIVLFAVHICTTSYIYIY